MTRKDSREMTQYSTEDKANAFLDGSDHEPMIDPYSEETVHLVALPGEEFEFASLGYKNEPHVSEDPAIEKDTHGTRVYPFEISPPYVDCTQVMQRAPQSSNESNQHRGSFVQGVHPVEYGSSPVAARSASGTNAVLIAMVCALVFAVIVVIALIVWGLPEKKVPEMPSGPSILTSEQEDKQRDDKSAPANLVSSKGSQGLEEKPLEQKDSSLDETEKDASFKVLSESYKNVEGYDKKISQLVGQFNSSLTGDLSQRKTLLAQAENLLTDIKDSQENLKKQSTAQEYRSQKEKIETLYKLLKQRTEVVEESLKISVRYDDVSKHTDEVLKPFVEAYAPGEQRSKYIKEYEQLYPQAQPQEIK